MFEALTGNPEDAFNVVPVHWTVLYARIFGVFQ